MMTTTTSMFTATHLAIVQSLKEEKGERYGYAVTSPCGTLRVHYRSRSGRFVTAFYNAEGKLKVKHFYTAADEGTQGELLFSKEF